MHPERAGGQAGRVDRTEMGGVQGDRDDLLAAVEHLGIEPEPHTVRWMTPRVGADAWQQHPRGGCTGGQKRATGDGRSHVNSFALPASKLRAETVYRRSKALGGQPAAPRPFQDA